jgi:phosphoglycerate dehydrogenase-like enzyme
MTNRVGEHTRSVANGEWERAIDWSYTLAPMQELAGKTIGIVGFGHIGRQVSAYTREHRFCKQEPADIDETIWLTYQYRPRTIDQ